MRYWIDLILGCTVGFSAAASPAQAGLREDCNQRTDHDLAIRACSDLVRRNPRDALALSNRGDSYRMKRDYERAIVDLDEAVRLNPYYARAFGRRGAAYRLKGDYDRAISDLGEAIRLDPGYVMAHTERGIAYRMKGEYDRAIADLNQAIRLDPRFDFAFAERGIVYRLRGDYTRAVADLSEAVRLNPRNTYAASELSLAKLSPSALGPPLAAVKPMVVAPPKAPVETSPFASAIAPPPSVALGRRVALAIGNAAYKHVQPLPNPRKDAADVATALKAAGFADVEALYDLGLREMQRALAAFERKATGADWAVVYYGGHGIQVDGRNFLVPVDAKLEVATDVEDETLALERVLARMAQAGKLQLVILDACRDNPFKRAWSGNTRTVAERGLARFDPTLPNVFVAYAARDGQAALDGPPGANSPYAKALVRYLAEPGLELQMFFRRVRDQVLKDTGRRQQPFEYGSLSSESLFFKPAR